MGNNSSAHSSVCVWSMAVAAFCIIVCVCVPAP